MSSMSTEGRGKITAPQIQDILIRNAGAASDAFEENGNATLEDLGLDSLAILELQSIVKDRFGLEVPEEALGMNVTEIVAAANESAGE